jgi:twinkle protein
MVKIIDLETKTEYEVDLKSNGENKQICPKCSESRKEKNKKLKCFSFNKQLNVGYCNHCTTRFAGKNDFKPTEKVVYKKPIWKNNTNLSDKALRWFEQRGISQTTLNQFKIAEGLEYMPQQEKEVNTVQFPYFRHGELINIKYRDGLKNFKLSSGAELVFYNIDSIIGCDEVIICEGEIDCMSIYQSGFKNVISVPNGAGASSLVYLDSAIDLFDDETKYIIAVDNDAAGLKLRNELVRRLGFENCKEVIFGNCKDANECLQKNGIQGVIDAIANAKEFPITGVFTAKDIDSQIDDYYNNGLPKGENIGMVEFDRLLKFHKGYITIITGVPNMGKSEVLDFICVKLNVLHDWKFALYSPENHPLQLHFSKIAEKFIGKVFSQNENGRMSKMELSLVKEHFNKNFFFIKPETDFTLDSILQSVKTLVKRHGVNAFVIDAWNKLDHQYTNNETQYISKELDKLAMFCEVNNVHLFLVAHPTKLKKLPSGEWETPTLYSINGSSNFFNKAANGLSVGRDTEGFTEVYVQKVKFKHWGQQGLVKWAWNRNNGRYYSGYEDNTNWLIKGEQAEMPLTTMKPNESFESDNTEIVPFTFTPTENQPF